MPWSYSNRYEVSSRPCVVRSGSNTTVTYQSGDLLTDRRGIARDYGFGSGTSCYDNVLILGDVTVGKHCWIGPNVILKGVGNTRHSKIEQGADSSKSTSRASLQIKL
jgi:acetyltransferase-like isoleucine patch superfamily enzyme